VARTIVLGSFSASSPGAVARLRVPGRDPMSVPTGRFFLGNRSLFHRRIPRPTVPFSPQGPWRGCCQPSGFIGPSINRRDLSCCWSTAPPTTAPPRPVVAAAPAAAVPAPQLPLSIGAGAEACLLRLVETELRADQARGHQPPVETTALSRGVRFRPRLIAVFDRRVYFEGCQHHPEDKSNRSAATSR